MDVALAKGSKFVSDRSISLGLRTGCEDQRSMTDITWTCSIYITGRKATENRTHTRTSRTFFSLRSVPAGGGYEESGQVILRKGSTARLRAYILLVLVIIAICL